VRRILDLGCGTGKWPMRLGARPGGATLIGVDISHAACVAASQKSGDLSWTCVCARGEQLPLADASMDFVCSTVALPYMNIPVALAEIRRVLKPGGSVDVSLHALSFTLLELRRRPPMTPRACLYRLYVIANGLWFHLSGAVAPYLFSSRVESWQSERGIRIALQRAGFVAIRCTSLPDHRFFVQALRPDPMAGAKQLILENKVVISGL
jgi:ubiquinone/menaquinone biosynthesis C-methylase UbiE